MPLKRTLIALALLVLGAFPVLAQTTSDIPFYYESFERGFVVARPNTETVYVFTLHDLSVSTYAIEDYAAQPRSADTPPADLSVPDGIVGRIWANAPGVRDSLGYSTGTSSFYLSKYTENASDTRFTLPEGVTVSITADNRWTYASSTVNATNPTNTAPPPTATSPPAMSIPATTTPNPSTDTAPEVLNIEPAITTDAVYQPFQSGLMIWRGDTDTIYVFYYRAATGTSYPNYQSLPQNPVADTAPDGLMKPVRGFGQVWGNNEQVRRELGWATEQEQPFTLTHVSQTFFPRNQIVYMTHPFGGTIRWDRYVSTWERLDSAPEAAARADRAE